MKRKYLVIMLLSFFTGDLYGETNYLDHREKRTGFFTLDFVNEFIPAKTFQYYSSSLDLKFGGELMPPQHTGAIGVRLGLRDVNILLKYNYDFIEEGTWIPGASASLLFGISPRQYHDLAYTPLKPNQSTEEATENSKKEPTKKIITTEEDSGRYITFGVNLEAYVKRFVSKNVAVVLRTGISHPLISVKGLDKSRKFSDMINLYIGVGVRWYLL